MIAIRGAITVDTNTEKDILKETENLLKEIIKRNNIVIDKIVSILFSATKDLTKIYPAVAARHLGIEHAGLFCIQEMNVENSMKKCLRVLVHVNMEESQNTVQHVYLKEAVSLRPDLNAE